MYGFNSQLYNNFSEAVLHSQGVVAISVLLQVSAWLFTAKHTIVYTVSLFTPSLNLEDWGHVWEDFDM